MILLIDNYDSFVHNLARYVGELGYERRVLRNDAVTIAEIEAMRPEALILSPGPCTPDEAGICLEAVRRLAPQLPILGICLGHQCIAQAFGGAVRRAAPRHGRASPIRHNGALVFAGLPNPFEAARYHSLAVDLPEGGVLQEAARAEDDGEIMALAHESLPVTGLQFHPESVLTPLGHKLLANFFAASGLKPSKAPRLPQEESAP